MKVHFIQFSLPMADIGEAFTALTGAVSPEKLQFGPCRTVATPIPHVEFNQTPILDKRVDDFTAKLVGIGGKVLSNTSADDFCKDALLQLASQYPNGVHATILIFRFAKEPHNLTQDEACTYGQKLLEELQAAGRVTLQEPLVFVNPAEPIWAKNIEWRLQNQLLDNIRARTVEISNLLGNLSTEWNEPDMFYRFYHTSFKVYGIQDLTLQIVDILRQLDPRPGKQPFNKMFETLLAEGTGQKFDLSHNQDWPKHTRPMLECFYHARMFLICAQQSAKDLTSACEMLPSHWAAFLYLYDMR